MIDFESLPDVVAVVGSRDFPHLHWVTKVVNHLREGTVVVSGAARGTDTAAKRAAYERDDLFYKEFAIEGWEWNKFGNKVGPLRNGHIVKYLRDHDGVMIIFHTKSSKGVMSPGSADDVRQCLTNNIPYILISEHGEVAGTLR